MTIKIIRPDNSIEAGYLEGEPLNFNCEDYRLHNAAGKTITGIRRRFRFHIFNYLGIITGEHLIGLAAVSLGFADNVFAYIIDLKKGMLFEYKNITPTVFGPSSLYSAYQPDNYNISFSKKNASLAISKHARKSLLEVNARFSDTLTINGQFDYDMKKHLPLRVADSAGLSNWGFTEKCPRALTRSLSVAYKGSEIRVKPEETFLIYDFSAGFMHRHTEWFWTAFSGRDKSSGDFIGGNFATNNNYPLYSENGLWIGKKRYYFYNNIAYSFKKNDPHQEWSLYTVDERGRPDKKLELVFKPAHSPEFLREENINMLLIRSSFSQYFGRVSGVYRDGRKKINFSNIYGISETHSTDW
ncbi:MAG TPA: DUF2804 family protein [Spirochaetota bacterium]|nr:DUF2804 family protein [Spirochaetota bacterium]HPI90708.1 DUF2804 family protein [Spirochaetota bacterium]HPR49975.1 DUF2804 family protein [Spirochaetota bacterium]